MNSLKINVPLSPMLYMYTLFTGITNVVRMIIVCPIHACNTFSIHRTVRHTDCTGVRCTSSLASLSLRTRYDVSAYCRVQTIDPPALLRHALVRP